MNIISVFTGVMVLFVTAGSQSRVTWAADHGHKEAHAPAKKEEHKADAHAGQDSHKDDAHADKGGHAAGHGEPGMSPQAAYKLLVDGNSRFVANKTERPHQDAETRKKLANGQKPHTIVLSCSDSRVPPELVFDQGLGDLFIVRAAGQVLSSPAIASIEYAVEHLGSKLIVVLGHESCGAVKAALTTPSDKSAGSQHLDSLVASIQRNLSDGSGKSREIASEDKKLYKPVKTNVSGVARELKIRSKILAEKIKKRDLAVVEGIYQLDSGKVEFWNAGGLEH